MATSMTCPRCRQQIAAPPPILLVTCACGARVRLHDVDGPPGDHQPIDLYQVLGVEPTAGTDEIRAAYRRRARESHPDVGGDPVEFQAVHAAWEVLGDPERRRDYDQGRRGRTASGGRGGAVDVPDLLGVSLVVAVRRLAAHRLTPRIMLHASPPGDSLHDLVIGQHPAPGAHTTAGSTVDVVVSGSDASVLWRGLRRDADRVADHLRESAVESAAVALDTGRRVLAAALRVIALALVIAVALVLGVHKPILGLIVLAIGGALVARSWVRAARRPSRRRRIRHRQ